MIGEKNLIPELENQYINLLNFIDNLGLSYNTRIDLYRRFQNELYNRSIKHSIEQGRKLEEKRENTIRSSKLSEHSENTGFSEQEEVAINRCISYLNEHGIDAPITFLHTPDEEELKLWQEARRRIQKQEKMI